MSWKKKINKELAIIKKYNEDFEDSTKCRICDNDYTDGDIKVRDHCRNTEKYRGYVHKHCNINVKLNHKTPVVFHNLKKYDLSYYERIRQIQS